ncbi:MAG: glycosyltransferase family 1 protein [Sphingomicrobium sp.]
MILGVNGIGLVGKRSGVGRAIEALVGCLGEIDQPFRDIRIYSPKPIDPTVRLPSIARNIVIPSPVSNALWEQIVLPRAHGGENLLFCPSYVSPVFARCPTYLIHHGSYEGYPKAFGWWRRNKARFGYALSARCASAVSTVSESSKRDMVRFYGIEPSRIRVVPEGVDTSVFRPIFDRQQLSKWRRDVLGEDVPFISYVGKPTERRNLCSLIRAFALLKVRDGLPHKLLIAGTGLSGSSPFRQVIVEERLEQYVHVRDYVGHDEMPLLYSASSVFVYPSSYEGFGMPVLEAMACGTPSIALNNTAFPEFASGVALLLEDAEPSTLRDGILAVVTDEERRARMSEAGPRRAAAYDWRKLTERHIEIMLSLVANPTRPA